MKVVVAGGTGLVGRHLTDALRARGDAVTVLSRSPAGPGTVDWDPTQVDDRLLSALDGTDALVNVAGSSVGGWPWTPGRRRTLAASRIGTTRVLVEALARLPAERRPRTFLSASSNPAYEGDAGLPESDGAPHPPTFLGRLCVEWEAAANAAARLGVRVVNTRFGHVLARDGDALRAFALPVRWFIGGRVGSGSQWVTWVHADDAAGLLTLAIDRDDIAGPFNVCSPDPRRQREFVRAIGKALHRPSLMPAPGFAVRLLLPGGQSSVILGGRRFLPVRAQELGYVFRYPELEDALAAELG